MSVKIKQVVPVTGEFLLDEATMNYNTKYLDKSTTVEVVQIEEGRYSIECEYDEAVNGAQVVKLCRQTAEENCDGIFVDCFGDPGVRGARECTDVPVFGGFEPAMLIAMGLGDKIGIVTVLKNVVPLIEGNIAKAHFDQRVTKVRVADMPVADLEDTDKLIERLVPECLSAAREDGAQVIVLGCTGMIDVAETVQKRLAEKGCEIPVIEAAQAALNMVEMYAKMGLKPSRMTYMRPPVK